MSNAIRSIHQSFVFNNSCIQYLALIFNLNYQSMTVLYAKKSVAGPSFAKYNYSYTFIFEQLIQTNGLVVEVSSSESGDMGSIADEP